MKNGGLIQSSNGKEFQSGKSGEVSLLINSFYFFLECVLIMNKEDSYRLIAVHNGRLLMDEPYRTIKGAKIAFTKMFGERGWKEDIKASWSIFYKPDISWLKKKLGAEKCLKGMLEGVIEGVTNPSAAG